jgi:putative two-component system response regulator
MHMVLVDDNEINLLIFEHHAQMLGICTHCFTDPLDALAYLKESQCDMIITDYMMPIMDGLAFVRAFRKISSAYVPIILSTAVNNDDALRAKAFEAGVDDFLPKPIDATIFRTTVISLLKKGNRPVD